MARPKKDSKDGNEYTWKRLPTGKRVRVMVGEDVSALENVGASIYTSEKGDAVVELWMQGKTFAEIGKIPGMPPASALYRWMQRHPGFREQIKAAKEIRAVYCAEKAIEHAEEAKEFDVQSRRLKVDTMKWAAGVLDPESYGTRTKVVGDKNAPVAFIIDTGIQRDPAPTDVPPTSAALPAPEQSTTTPTTGGDSQ